MSNYAQGQVLAIIYDVWISGTMLSIEKKACIESIEIKESVEGADTATIQIHDPNFFFIEDNIFLEDNPVKIKLGWDNTTYRVEFNGYISAIDIDFKDTGIPSIRITCIDNTHLMNREERSETYTDCTSADVVKKVVAKYGFTAVIDSGYEFNKQETITQSKQTDIDFLTKLANDEVHPFTARLVGNQFYYMRKGLLLSPIMELTYKNFPHDIISFSPKINKETKQDALSNSAMDTGTKEVASNNAKPTKGSGSGGGSATASGSSNAAASKGNMSYSNDNSAYWSAEKDRQATSGGSEKKYNSNRTWS